MENSRECQENNVSDFNEFLLLKLYHQGPVVQSPIKLILD